MIGLYCRVSTQEQKESGYSLEEQQDRLKNYCTAMGWKSFKVYVDGGFSGAKMDRPALKELIEDVKSGKIKKVVVYKLDRLSRSQKDTLYLIEDVFLSHGCDFVSMTENFDTSTPLGRAMIGILSVFAQLEREQIRERMMMGREARSKQGRWFGSCHIPVGYDYEDGELIVNDYYGMQVKEAFEMIASGLSSYHVARIFDEKGYLTQYGKPWSAVQIRRVVCSKVYAGYVSFNKRWYKGNHEPIVSEELLEKTTQIIKSNSDAYCKNRSFSHNPIVHTYLGGLLWCGKCGARMSRCHNSSHGKSYDYYACYSRTKKVKCMIVDPDCDAKFIKIDELDEMVFNEIRKLKLEVKEKGLRKTKPSKDSKEREILEKRIKEIDAQESRLLDLYATGKYTFEMLDEKTTKLNDEREKLTAQLTALSAPNRTNEKEMVKCINSFDDVLKRGNMDEIRGILFALIDKIVVLNGDVTIHWKF